MNEAFMKVVTDLGKEFENLKTIRLPNAYCLTLRQTPERMALAEQHFQERQVPVDFFYGVHGPTSGLRTVHLARDDYRMPSGHVGCYLSHWMLWSALTLVPGDEFLIFEDDVELVDGFVDKFRECRPELPADWDWTYVGYFPSPEKPKEQINWKVFRFQFPYPFGFQAYLVKKSALPKLLESMQEVKDHIDVAAQYQAFRHLNVYGFAESLAGQRLNESLTTISDDGAIHASVVDQISQAFTNMEGWCSVEKARLIRRAVIDTRAECCVEIGTFGGRGVYAMALGLQYLGTGKAYGIDPWDSKICAAAYSDIKNKEWWANLDMEEIYRKCCKALNDLRVASWIELIRKDSETSVKDFQDESIGVLHIDGNHHERAALQDSQLWLAKVKPGGIIFYDDFSWNLNGVHTTRPGWRWLLANGCTMVDMVDDCAVLRKAN